MQLDLSLTQLQGELINFVLFSYMTIYHNPRCRKSRETLKIINEHGIEPQKILYLDDVPSQKQLKEILKKLSLTAENIVRKTESIYKEKFKSKTLTEKEWIQAMIKYPKLIQRPIVVKGSKAIIGRPPSNVMTLIK